jgi:hypothetical protein
MDTKKLLKSLKHISHHLKLYHNLESMKAYSSTLGSPTRWSVQCWLEMKKAYIILFTTPIKPFLMLRPYI